MFFRGTSTAFSVRPGSFMGVNSLAFEFGGPLARLLLIDTRHFVTGPAVGELPGSDGRALAHDLQLVLQTVLVLLGLVELLHSLVCNRE